MFPFVWQQCHDMLCRTWYRLHVFPRSTLATCVMHLVHVAFVCTWYLIAAYFPALCAGYMLFCGNDMLYRTWYRVHVLLRLTPFACIHIPLSGTDCMFPIFRIGGLFSRVFYPLHVFPGLVSVSRFPALRTGCIIYLAELFKP